MANQAQKRIQKKNEQVKFTHTIAYLVILIVHILYKFIWMNNVTVFNLTIFAVLNLITLAIYWQIKSGVDLSHTKGVMSFYWDSLYISWFVLFTYTWFNVGLYFLLLMPISFVMMVYSFFRK